MIKALIVRLFFQVQSRPLDIASLRASIGDDDIHGRVAAVLDRVRRPVRRGGLGLAIRICSPSYLVGDVGRLIAIPTLRGPRPLILAHGLQYGGSVAQLCNTLFHEAAHATGVPAVLGRYEVLPPDRGSLAYLLEEIIAWRTAAALDQWTGVDQLPHAETSRITIAGLEIEVRRRTGKRAGPLLLDLKKQAGEAADWLTADL